MITLMRWLNDKFLRWRLRRLLRRLQAAGLSASDIERHPERAARALRLRQRLIETITRIENGAEVGPEVDRLWNEFQREWNQ